jgi:hypothetical protein
MYVPATLSPLIKVTDVIEIKSQSRNGCIAAVCPPSIFFARRRLAELPGMQTHANSKTPNDNQNGAATAIPNNDPNSARNT